MDKNRIMMVAWGYLGAVIGAGFASGQEIVQFFVGYGTRGFYGTLEACLLFAIFGAVLLYWTAHAGLRNYQSVLESLFGRQFSRIVDVVLTMFLFMGICTMFSAGGAVFYEHLNLSKNLGVLTAYLCVLILLITGVRGLVSSYSLLVPVKVVLLLAIAGIAAAKGSGTAAPCALPSYEMTAGAGSWALAGILYVAYNFALAMVVLSEYQALTDRRASIIGAGVGGLILGLIAMICYLALRASLPTILHYEVPMLYVAGTISSPAKFIYTIVLLLGILTTAIANTYGFAQRFSQFTGLEYRLSLVITATMALPLAFQNFAFLVATVYPLFGVVGVIILIALLLKTSGLKIQQWGYYSNLILTRILRYLP